MNFPNSAVLPATGEMLGSSFFRTDIRVPLNVRMQRCFLLSREVSNSSSMQSPTLNPCKAGCLVNQLLNEDPTAAFCSFHPRARSQRPSPSSFRPLSGFQQARILVSCGEKVLLYLSALQPSILTVLLIAEVFRGVSRFACRHRT